MLHYFAQNFFAAVLPVGFEDNDVLHIYAISDLSGDTTLWAVVRCPHINITDMLQQTPGGPVAVQAKVGTRTLILQISASEE